QHSNSAGIHLRNRRKQQDDQQECSNCNPQQTEYRVGGGVDYSATPFIKDRHNLSSPARLYSEAVARLSDLPETARGLEDVRNTAEHRPSLPGQSTFMQIIVGVTSRHVGVG